MASAEGEAWGVPAHREAEAGFSAAAPPVPAEAVAWVAQELLEEEALIQST